MKLKEVQDILGAQVLCGEDHLQSEVHNCFGSDMMSDVLAFAQEDTLLITGLVNHQVIRTAEMAGIFAVAIVRGKMPEPDVIEMARERDILLMQTSCLLFDACGKLYEGGLRGAKRRDQ
ncbi:MAG: DRTGG domain-containing protein [Christensenellales bacterium]|jgi:predicted transcriptional regulator